MSTLEDRSKQFAKERADGQAAHSGDRQAALSHFVIAQAASPADVVNNYEIAVMLRELKRNDEAVHAYEKVIAAAPRHIDGLRGLGLVERARGDHAKAAHWFSRALEIDPSGLQNKLDLAFELRETKQNHAADALYAEVLTIQPANSFALRKDEQ